MTIIYFRWYVLSLAFCLFCNNAIGQGNENLSSLTEEEKQPADYFFGFNVRYYPYQSFSQTNPSFPFKIGYPTFLADVIAFEAQAQIAKKRFDHLFYLTYSIPSAVTSDNGLGSNILLRPAESSYSRLQMMYNLNLPLFSAGKLEARYGGTASLLYEERGLTFNSGRVDSQWDIGAGIGPMFSIYYPLTPMLAIQAQGHFLFYVPYLSYGKLESQLAGNEPLVSDYYSFVYATCWDAHFQVNPRGDVQLRIGYRRNDQVGFGNSAPSFKVHEQVSYKLERFNEFYFGAVIKIGER